MLIHHFIEKNAVISPDKVAVVCDDVRCTYAELNAMANNLAGWLLDQGLKSGDRVALLLNNSVEYVVSYYGILKAGGVAAPLGSDLKPDRLRILMQKLQATALITSARFERLVEAAGCSAPGIHRLLVVGPTRSWNDATFVTYSWDEAISGGTTTNPVVPQEERNLASIIFTSGSTGQPKGVMLSHANIVANTSSICQYLGLSAADRQMVVLPFHYVMGKSLLNTHMAVGGSVVINNRFAFPADVLQQMAREEVTGFSGVPSTYAYLMHRS
ncbi:MAG: class I adenylate-forming enzyme family protein, partial [Desulfuromonadaceae bacterium]|nr:class I adenylate-forming enzyme family protein [Desulfuromonadaceae bacterium]